MHIVLKGTPNEEIGSWVSNCKYPLGNSVCLYFQRPRSYRTPWHQGFWWERSAFQITLGAQLKPTVGLTQKPKQNYKRTLMGPLVALKRVENKNTMGNTDAFVVKREALPSLSDYNKSFLGKACRMCSTCLFRCKNGSLEMAFHILYAGLHSKYWT